MKRTLTVVFVLVALAATVLAQSKAPTSLEGVWKVTEESFSGATVSTNTNPQPSLLIFTKGYYSFIRVVGLEARTLFKSTVPTNEEKLTAFDQFTASSGSYELAGTTLTIRPIVAKHPNFMAGGSEKYEVRLEGDTLWLMAKYTDIHMRVDDRIVPASGPASESRRKLIRVE